MRFIKRKRKAALGEREVSSINWPLLVILLAVTIPICGVLVMTGRSYWLENEEPNITIMPYGYGDATSPPPPVQTSFAAAPQGSPSPMAYLTEAPSLTPAPTTVAQVRITVDTALFVEQLEMFAGYKNEVSSVVFSSDGSVLVVGNQDGTVKLLSAENGTELNVFRSSSGWVDSVAFSTETLLVAAGGHDEVVRLWHAGTGEALPSLQGPTGAVRSVAFNPKGTIVAAGSDDGMVYLWDPTTGENVATFRGHTDYVTSIAFNSDGTVLASGSADDTVRVWKVPSGASLAVLPHAANVSGVAFNPVDGSQLASIGADTTVRLWDWQNQTERAVLDGHSEIVNSVTFNPDGTLVASAAGGIQDNTVRFWDAATGAQVWSLSPDGPVNSVAFSPDGTLLATGGATYLALWGVGEDAAAMFVPTPTRAPTRTVAAPAGSSTPHTTAVPADSDTCIVTAKFDEVNLRAGPGTAYDLVGQLLPGEGVEADGWAQDIELFTWWRLVTGSWVRADVVDWPEVCLSLPFVEP